MDLFLASAKSVSTLVTILCVGTVFGYYPRPHGLLTPTTVKAMASLVMYVFSPALLISTYATRLSLPLLANTLTMAAWCCVHVAVCVGVGHCTLPLARPSARLAGVYRVSLVFGNAASLPFLLLTTLVQRPALRADAGAFDRGIVYTFSYLILWFVFMYSIGFEMLMPPREEEACEAPSPVAAALAAAAPAAPAAAAAAAAALPAAPAPALDARAVLHRTLQQPPILATVVGVLLGLTPLGALFWGAAPPLEGVGAVVSLLGQGSIASANIVLAGSLFSALVELRGEALAWLGEAPPPAGASGSAVLAASASLFARALRRRLAGGSSGGAVQLQDEEEEEEGAGAAGPRAAHAPGQASPAPAPRAPSAAAAAAAALPAGKAGGGSSSSSSSSVFFSVHTTAVLIAARLLLCPALCFALFYAAQSWGVPVLACSDPMLTIVVLLQAAMPSAQTLLVVASNVGNEGVGRALSLVFLIMYPCACLALIPWIALALRLAGV
jgi:predicted permease